MSRPFLVRFAAALALITCVGHLIGTFMKIPPEQTAMHATLAAMKATMVPMPVGAARSYLQILDGNNLCTGLFLLFCAAQLAAVAGTPNGPAANRVLLLTGLALGGFATLSAIYFFPVPTVTTGLAAVLAFLARIRPGPLA